MLFVKLVYLSEILCLQVHCTDGVMTVPDSEFDEYPPDEEQDSYDTSYPYTELATMVPTAPSAEVSGSDDEYPPELEGKEEGFYDTLFPSTEPIHNKVTITDVVQACTPSTSAGTESTEPTDEDVLSEPLYNGAQITMGLSLILIMSFAINPMLSKGVTCDPPNF